LRTEFFIARRLTFAKESDKNFSRPIVNIAVLGISLGLAVMILAIAIITGFKNEVRDKIVGFGSHIQILNYDNNNSFEATPIRRNEGYYQIIKDMPSVKNIQAFATKAGILKTETDLHGIVLKGVDSDFNWDFFKKNLLEGDVFEISDSGRSNDVLISKYIANLLHLNVGDDATTFFIQQPPRMRKFYIKGIYQTGMEDFDKIFVICDIKHIQRLNDWQPNLISGYEILVNDINKIEETYLDVENLVGYDFFEDGSRLKVMSIKEKYRQIFDWLSLLDMNVWIILIVMLAVALVNMISGLLILILDKINMIGILKAIGAYNSQVRAIFMYQGLFLILKGLLWGNIAGIGLSLFQKYTHIIKLDPASYYINTVPINMQWDLIFLLNIGFLVITFIMLIFPAMVISKISPDKTIKFG